MPQVFQPGLCHTGSVSLALTLAQWEPSPGIPVELPRLDLAGGCSSHSLKANVFKSLGGCSEAF